MSEFVVFGREGGDEVAKAIDALDPRSPFLVTIRPMRPNRTSDQNAMMWLLLRELAQGGDASEMKDQMSCRYFGFREVPIEEDGRWFVRILPLVQNTSALDTETMGGFLDYLYATLIEWCVS